MRKTVFVTQNSNKSDAFRLMTTIEQEDGHISVYKRPAVPASVSFMNELIQKQDIIQSYVGSRADVLRGTLTDRGIRYDFIAHSTLQNHIANAILQNDYNQAYQMLEQWIVWIEQLPTRICIPTNYSSVKSLFGDTIPSIKQICLSVGLIDLTADNVFVSDGRYTLIDHELVIDAPVPRDLVIFRVIFFLCIKLQSILLSNVHRQPLKTYGSSGFLVPASWDIRRWIDVSRINAFIRSEEHLQNYFSALPVQIVTNDESDVIVRDYHPSSASSLREHTKLQEQLGAAYHSIHERNIQINIYSDEIIRLREDLALSRQHAQNLQLIIEGESAQLREDLALSRQHAQNLQLIIIDHETSKERMQHQIAALDGEVARVLRQKQAVEGQFILYQRRIEEMHSGIGYRALTYIRDTRWRLMPPGTRSNKIYMSVRHAAKFWRDHGVKAMVRKTVKAMLMRARLGRVLRLYSATELVAHQDRTRLRSIRADVRSGEIWPETIFMRSSDSLYSEWLSNNVPTPADLRKQRGSISALEYAPLISIITPVYNVDARWLSHCIDSVIAQTYTNWELVLIDDKSTATHINPLLQQYAERDTRIRVHFSADNMGISGATNVGIEQARGEFLAFLDNDDELAPHALFSIIDRLQQSRQIDIIYSDEDKITHHDNRDVPHFKADYAPDMLHSYNYICHLLVVRTSLARAVGGLRSEFDGAQDYDFILRCVEATNRARIDHVADVLYHWRMIPGSTAASYDNKSAVRERTHQLLHEHLERTCGGGYGHIASDETRGTYHVQYALRMQPLVSIIICTKDKSHVLKTCIDSLQQTTYQRYEIIIVDNGSQESETHAYYRDILRPLKHIQIIEQPQPFNYSRINNSGIRQSRGDVIVLLNNDTELITPDWLEQMLGFVQQDRVGVVGAKLLYPNNTIQHAGIILGIGGVAGHSHKYIGAEDSGYFNIPQIVRNYAAVTGACMMFRRSVWEEVGGLEEELAVAFNDVEFCLKVGAAGYDIVYTPYVSMWHHESVSVGRVEKRERVMDVFEIEYMRRNWSAGILRDPFYNPNLTLTHENYAINPARRRPTEYTPEMIGHRAEPGVVQDYYNLPVGELVDGRRVEQSFVNERGDLFAVEILPATYARRNEGTLHVALLNADRGMLHEWNIPAADVEDNTWRRFSFPVIEGSANATFWIAIWCKGSVPQSALTVWHSTEPELYRSGEFMMDGRPAEGVLAFRCFVLVSM